jgi:hypothetical protein
LEEVVDFAGDVAFRAAALLTRLRSRLPPPARKNLTVCNDLYARANRALTMPCGVIDAMCRGLQVISNSLRSKSSSAMSTTLCGTHRAR